MYKTAQDSILEPKKKMRFQDNNWKEGGIFNINPRSEYLGRGDRRDVGARESLLIKASNVLHYSAG